MAKQKINKTEKKEEQAPRGKSGRIGWIVGVTVAVSLLALYGMAFKDGQARYEKSEYRIIAPTFEAQPGKEKQVPDFQLTDRFGRKISLSRFDSVDVLVVNIWSSGCPVCREEVPSLTEMDRRIGSIGNAALLTIAVAEKWEDVSAYFPQGTNLRILFDADNSVAKGVFGTDKYPETFILDKQRRIRARFDGARPWYSDAMFRYLSKFL